MTSSTEGFKGLRMEGFIANWYARNARRFQRAAAVLGPRLRPSAAVLEVAPGPGYLPRADRGREPVRERIEAWLSGDRPLRFVRIHELLAREGVTVSCSTLRRYAQRELGVGGPRVTVRLADAPPGEEAGRLQPRWFGSHVLHRSSTTSPPGCEQQVSVAPGVGGSTGSGR